jgi:endoglucanase
MKRLISIAALLCLAATSFAQQSAPAPTNDAIVALLQRLADAPGPPGFEEPVRKIMVEQFTPLADRISYDGLGSVIATRGSTGPRIMIDAHMDELGGVVRRITPDGLLTMQMLGGWLDQALLDQRWTIVGSKGPVRAITGIRDIHIVPPDERTRVYPRESVFLDVGAHSAEEVRAMGLAPGDPVAPDAPFYVMNGTNNYVGKGWDDRVGCAILIEVLRRLNREPHPNQLFFVATVQEEIGLRGAQTASAVVKPEIGIALEAGVVRDAPGVHPEEAQEKLGEGPAIFLYNSSELPNRKMAALIKETAQQLRIPLQPDLVQGYGDDGAEIQRSNGGVPTITLTIPTRFTHSHNGIINRADFDRTVDLLVAFIKKLDAATVTSLRDFAPPK